MNQLRPNFDRYVNNINQYVHTVEQNLPLDINFMTFKSQPAYRTILEHVSPQQARVYLIGVMREFGDFFDEHKDKLIELSHLNDKYGNPITANIPNFTTCSPTNLRYIYHSLLILDHMKKLNKKEIDIIEIGGGYGGLTFFLYHLSDIYGIKIHSYTIFDLPSICKLQKKYCDAHSLPVKTLNLEDKFTLEKGSYLISNYAFTELTPELQEEYTEKVIKPYVDEGLIVWNFIEVYDFIPRERLTIEQERPSTSPMNKFVWISVL